MRFLCLLFLGFLTVLPAPVSAATIDELERNFVVNPRELNSWKASIDYVTPRYAEGVRRLKFTSDDRRGIIASLRAYYPKTEQFNPFAQDILDEMTEYGYIIDTSKDSMDVNRALIEYRRLLDLHMGNLDVVSFALTLSRVDVRFGDEVMLKNVRDILIEETMARGYDGKGPDTAYQIVTFAEESYILQGYRPQSRTTELYEVGGQYYNVHEIIDENGEYQQVYIDIGIPIRSILMNAKAQKSYQAAPNPPR